MILAVTAFALLSAAAEGEPMTRIVVRDVSRELPAGDFGRKPKTIYRVGSCCVRIEEEKNPETGMHLVFISREPDIWILDREQMLAGHTLDEGPGQNAHVPVLFEEGLEGLEFGQELAFMKAHGAQREASVTCAAGQCAQYKLDHNGYRIALLAGEKTETPVEIRITAPNRQEVVFAYDAYETGMAAKPELFALPAGARVMKQQQEQPPPQQQQEQQPQQQQE